MSLRARRHRGQRRQLSPAQCSADGDYVTFASTATNLVAGGGNGQAQTYVYDTLTGAIALVSAAANGTPASNESDLASAVSADGSIVAFGSTASNLVTPDANAGYANIFVAGLNQAPGGTIDVTGTSTIEGSSTAYADLNNGTVTLGAQLTLDYVTVSGTQINEASGGSLVFDPTVQLTGGAVITGAPITNFDTLEVSGAASLIDDQVTNNAIVQVDAGGTLTLSGTTITGGTINDGTGSTFATAGTIDVIGNSTIAGAGTAQAYLNNGGVTVESGVTLTLYDGDRHQISLPILG